MKWCFWDEIKDARVEGSEGVLYRQHVQNGSRLTTLPRSQHATAISSKAQEKLCNALLDPSRSASYERLCEGWGESKVSEERYHLARFTASSSS